MGGDAFLIEVKWQNSPVDVAVIDDVRSRLERTLPYVTGLIMSMSGFTQTAIDGAATSRDRPILLVNKDEITRLVNSGSGLWPLLVHKRDALVNRGEVLFEDVESHWQDRVTPDPSKLPMADIRFSKAPMHAPNWVQGGGGFGHIVFAESIPDVDWTVALGSGVALDIHPDLGTREEAPHALELLRKLGWITKHGRFSIQQAHDYWYGAGARDFSLALAGWKQRYTKTKHPYHHTEEATYFDIAEGGLYTLTFDISSDERGEISNAQLSMQLPYVPLDTHQFQELLHAFDLLGERGFRSLPPKPVFTLWHWTFTRTPLVPTSFIYDSPSAWVRGIMAPNPFRSRMLNTRRISSEVKDKLEVLHELDLLPFRLRDWHEAEDTKMTYNFSGFEMTWTGDAAVFSLVADWNERPRRASPRRSSKPRKPKGAA